MSTSHIFYQFLRTLSSLDFVTLWQTYFVASCFGLVWRVCQFYLTSSHITVSHSNPNYRPNTHLKGDQCYQAKMLQVAQLKPNPALPPARWLPVYLVLVLQVVFRYQCSIQIVSQHYKRLAKSCQFHTSRILSV